MNQCQYATDVVLRKQTDLQAIYGNLTRTAIHTVKPDNIATFPGKKLAPQFEGEMGNRFNIRIEGTRIKHTMLGPVSLKLYDKFGLILRTRLSSTIRPFSSTTARWNIATAPVASSGRQCGKATVVFPLRANCRRLPTGVIWSFFR